MSVTLTTYTTQVRRILKDSSGEFWGTPADPNELTDYINEARRRVAHDTACFRQIQPTTLTQGTETFSIQTTIPLIPNSQAIDNVMIWVLRGNQRYPLGRRSYSQLSYKFRQIVNYQQTPQLFAIVGQTVYVWPIPNQDYQSEWDTVYIPIDLTSAAPNEFMSLPWTDLVQYWAAHKAYYKDKAYQEADALLQKYEYEKQMIYSAYDSVQRAFYNI